MASFECCRCKHTFEHRPGPSVACPVCFHNYCKWLDFERFRNLPSHTEAYRKVYPKKNLAK